MSEEEAWRDRVQSRRNALSTQMAQAQAEYEQLEQALALLQRNLDAMHGGLQELDALLGEVAGTGEAR